MQWPVRNPVTLHVKQNFSALDHLVNVELREAKLPMACVHTLKVLVNTEG